MYAVNLISYMGRLVRRNSKANVRCRYQVARLLSTLDAGSERWAAADGQWEGEGGRAGSLQRNTIYGNENSGLL